MTGQFGGRPRTRAVKKGDKIATSIRLPPAINRALRKAAAVSGRSLSTEAEYRIERSFDWQKMLTDLTQIFEDQKKRPGRQTRG